jgi:hypothetical protein
MKKILRMLTVLSVLLVATALLVACGGSSSGEQIDRAESANPYKKISIPLQTSRFRMR